MGHFHFICALINSSDNRPALRGTLTSLCLWCLTQCCCFSLAVCSSAAVGLSICPFALPFVLYIPPFVAWSLKLFRFVCTAVTLLFPFVRLLLLSVRPFPVCRIVGKAFSSSLCVHPLTFAPPDPAFQTRLGRDYWRRAANRGPSPLRHPAEHGPAGGPPTLDPRTSQRRRQHHRAGQQFPQKLERPGHQDGWVRCASFAVE